MIQKLFPVNEAPIDRTVRVLFGIGLLALALSGQSAWGYLASFRSSRVSSAAVPFTLCWVSIRVL